MAKVYLATRGTPGEYGYEILKAFTRRELAEGYRLGEGVEEFEVHDRPVPVVPRYVVEWSHGVRQPVRMSSYQAALDDRTDTEEDLGWKTVFQTWDEGRARQVYAERVAARERAAAEYVAGLGRIDVQVWYEPGDGDALLRTPLHQPPDHALRVPRDRIVEQAGLPEGVSLHGRWFTVETLTLDSIDGFSVRQPAPVEG